MQTLDQAIIAAAMLLMLLMGWRKKSAPENHEGSAYLLGGRSLTLPAFVATTVTTWYGGILGVGEYTYLYGVSNWIVFGVPYYFGAIVFALVLSRRARQTQSLTLPQQLRSAYGKKVAILAAILVVITTIPAAYALIIGALLQMSFGISLTLGVILAVLYTLVYIWRGGFSAVVHTDKLQFILMFGGFAMFLAFLLVDQGTAPLYQLYAQSPKHFSLSGGLDLGSILVWYFIALSTMVEPNFYQRCYAAKTPQIARRGILLSVLFWLIFDLMATTVGLYARAFLPELANPLHSFPALAQTILPTGLIALFFITLIATALSTLDSSLFTLGSTVGRDLLGANSGPELVSKTRIGLILGAAAAVALALSYTSVVALWRILGSLAAASLLIPILFAHYPRYKPGPRTTLAMILIGSCATLIWESLKLYNGHYPFNIQPLFVGLSLSILAFLPELCLRVRIKFKT